MNKWDHVPEHEERNDCNPHDKRFILQDLPVKRALFLAMLNGDLTVLRMRENTTPWPINQGKSRQEKKSSRQHTKRVGESKMNKHLLHGWIQNTSANCTTKCHYPIGEC